MPKRRREFARPPIFHLRKAADKTQEEFAEELGIHRVTLAKAEIYGNFVPGPVAGAVIAAAIGKTLGQVIDDYARHSEGSR